MTTLLPGASEVLTHGLTVRPFSTAALASRAAPSMTDGFEVFVHEVIEAMTTAPWSSPNDRPSLRVTGVGVLTRAGRVLSTCLPEAEDDPRSASSAWPLPGP